MLEETRNKKRVGQETKALPPTRALADDQRLVSADDQQLFLTDS
jgi:hypothetical protein